MKYVKHIWVHGMQTTNMAQDHCQLHYEQDTINILLSRLRNSPLLCESCPFFYCSCCQSIHCQSIVYHWKKCQYQFLIFDIGQGCVFSKDLYKDRMPWPRCELSFLIIFWPVNAYWDYCACVSGLAENLSADTDKQA